MGARRLSCSSETSTFLLLWLQGSLDTLRTVSLGYCADCKEVALTCYNQQAKTYRKCCIADGESDGGILWGALPPLTEPHS
jgi:hypothetical protein